MGKQGYKWYIVMYHSKKYHASLFEISKDARKFAKSKGLNYKGFMTKEEAIAYAGCSESKIHFHPSSAAMPSKICLVCEKPFKGKTQLCPICNKLRKTTPYPLTVKMAVAMKQLYPNQDIFSFANSSPHTVVKTLRATSPKERSDLKEQRVSTLKSDTYRHSTYTKDAQNIPDFVKRLLFADKTKTLLYLDGGRTNPVVYYLCHRCGQEQCQTYESLKAGYGHNCLSLKSSGEVVVEDFLKKLHLPYKTQHETVKCINPRTRKVMPYDFELTTHRVIIEVQGDQHLRFEPYFHGSIENFEYQVWKDRYKKEYAESLGYTVIYLNYKELETGEYESIILERINREH